MPSVLPTFAGVAAPVQGALLMTGAAVAFSGMIGLLRLATDALHPFEVAFFRNLFGLGFMLPWLLRTRFDGLRTARIGLHALRAGTGLVAMLLWFLALSLMPLGEAVALSFTTPLFVTIGAALVLGEVVRARRITATVVGFLGMLVIVRPGVEAVQPAALLVVVSAMFAAASALMVKSLSRTDYGNTIVTWMVVFLTPMSLIPALFVWQGPDPTTLAVLVGVAGLGTTGHLLFTRAMAKADISAVLPFEYLRLPLVALIGYLAFGEVIDAWSWLGAAIIIASTLYIAHREAVVARERRPHDPGPIAAGTAREKL
ncbi:MAG: EamA family transporter [Alphaproteobacteria bacterium]|jgi:drug/metabolite transporter (DMT)-like permease|nr:EamA family transporter [Alphaproteobacteria bacterium]